MINNAIAQPVLKRRVIFTTLIGSIGLTTAAKTQLFRNTAGIVPAATQFLSIFCSAERLVASNSSLIQTARLSKRLPVRQLMIISPVRSANRLMRLERVEISIPPGYLPRRG